MSKGLPRSLANAGLNAPVPYVQRKRYPINRTVNVAAAGAGVGFGTAVIGELPEGNIHFMSAVCNLGFSSSDTDLSATYNGDFSVGTDPDANGTLAANEINIIASTALGPATARVAPVVRATNITGLMLDNTDGAMELNLNVLIDAADITDATNADILCTGWLEIAYAVLGDD